MKPRIFSILLCCTLGFPARAQNTPVLTETAPSGTVTVIPSPLEPRWGTPPVGGQPAYPAYPNYIKNYVPMTHIGSVPQLGTAPLGSVKVSFEYKGGFNGTFQTVAKNFSRQGADYHDLIGVSETLPGREAHGFLPFTRRNNSGNDLYEYALGIQKSYYALSYPLEGYTSYSQSNYTSDATKRQAEQFAAGKSQVGQKKGAITIMGANDANAVRVWDVDAQGWPVTASSYGARQLAVSTTTLVDNSRSVTFTDKSGNVVLRQVSDKKSGATYTYASTYYVYDESGRLRHVLPPKAVAALESANWVLDTVLVNGLCFQYRYDEKERMYAKRSPGEDGFTEIVYDRYERAVMRRTPTEAAANQWEVIFHDRNGRVLATSLYGNAQDRLYWQGQTDGGGTFPATDIRRYIVENSGQYPPENISGNRMISYAYYDNYALVDPNDLGYDQIVNQIAFSETASPEGAEPPSRSLRTQGMVVGTKTRILPAAGMDTATTGDWRTALNFYDDKGRGTYSMVSDAFNGQVIHRHLSAVQYDFAGRMLVTKHLVTNYLSTDAVKEHVEVVRNIYDPALGVLLRTEHKMDGGNWVQLAAYEYDDLNRVKREILGNYGEVRDYGYNIRGQLTGINGVYAETGNKGGESRSFGQSLKYDYGFTQPRTDGKPAGMVWRGSDAKMHAYGYGYDAGGRLTSADYRRFEDQVPGQVYGWSNAVTDRSLYGMQYDKNGNVLKMSQKGPQSIPAVPYSQGVTIDSLAYGYQAKSNRLLKVSDAVTVDYGIGDFQDGNTGTDYGYDANGNLTKDLNKGVTSITYTHFNKPSVITMTGSRSIRYGYDAGGNKVQEKITQPGKTKVTDYIGNFVYRDGKLAYAQTGTGRTVFDNDTAKEEFFVKDNLGNIRSVVDVFEYRMQEYLAQYELASANLEGLFFEHHGELRDDKPGSTDPEDMMAGRLNGNDPERRVGTALLLKVMAGDRLQLDVNSYYEGYDRDDDEPLSDAGMLGSVVGTLTGGVGGAGGGEAHDPGMVSRLFSSANWTKFNNLVAGGTDPDKPKAFLNYILFSERGDVVAEGSGRFQADGEGTWSEMGTQIPIVIPGNGYVGIFLSNGTRIPITEDNPHAGDVYFDLLRVRFTRGKLKEENHYYPFGLPMGDISGAADGFKPNRHRYQGNEYVQDLGLDWMDFHARQYDPQIGRFLGVDPLADGGGQERFSPYAAMGNNPAVMVDPGGMKFGDREDNNLNLIRPNIPVSPSLRSMGGGGIIWLPKGGGAFDYANGMDAMTKAYVELIWNSGYKKINGDANMSDETQRINDHNAEYKGSDGFGAYSYYDPVDDIIFYHRPTPSGGFQGFDWNGILNQLGNMGTGISGLGGGFSLAGDSRVSWLLNNNFRGGVNGNYLLKGRNLSLFGSKVTPYSMPTSKLLRYGARLGNVGTGVAVAGLVWDAGQVNAGNMSLGRFGYHVAGFGASVGAGALTGSVFGGPIGTGVGAAVGVGFGAGEIMYDEVIRPQIAEPFNRGFDNFIKGYFNIPGW